jgi:hypothetical protein
MRGIMTALPIVVSVIVNAAVILAIISSVPSTRVFIVAQLSFLNVSVLVCRGEHITNSLQRLTIELRAKVTVVETMDEGRDDLCFGDIGN